MTSVPLLGIATQLPALTLPARASTGPVLRILHAETADAAFEMVSRLRKAPGCMKADVFAADNGRFSVFQTWVSEEMSEQHGALSAPLTLSRLEI